MEPVLRHRLTTFDTDSGLRRCGGHANPPAIYAKRQMLLFPAEIMQHLSATRCKRRHRVIPG